MDFSLIYIFVFIEWITKLLPYFQFQGSLKPLQDPLFCHNHLSVEVKLLNLKASKSGGTDYDVNKKLTNERPL